MYKKIHKFIVEEKLYFIIMELFEGSTLSQFICELNLNGQNLNDYDIKDIMI